MDNLERMGDVFLSVVTPSYEQAEFLSDNLESVKEQSGASVEHIVIDGGSNDGTVDLLRQYEDHYDLQWVSEPDDGQSHAINKGLEMASGEWICWVNSDDYLLPGALESFVRSADKHRKSNLIYGDYIFVDKAGNTIGRRYSSRPSKFVHKHYYQFTSNHSLIIKRETLRSIGGVDEDLDYVMDTELLWRLLNEDLDMARIDCFVGARRLHEAAKTTGEPPTKRRKEIQELRTKRYRLSKVERKTPSKLLAIIGLIMVLIYHVLDGRPEAIKHEMI